MPTLPSRPNAPSASWALSVLLALSCGCGLLIANAAQASIVTGQSIAGVQLGATETQVKAALRGQTHEQPALFHSELFYNEFLRIFFKRGQVDKVLSYSNKQKTTQGITIGSTQTQIKSAYPKAVCEEGHNPVYFYCVLAGHAQGRKSYTGFLLEETGGVVEIELGYGSVKQALSKP